jgi:hypothetical protein
VPLKNMKNELVAPVDDHENAMTDSFYGSS